MRHQYGAFTYSRKQNGGTGCENFNDDPVRDHFADELELTNATRCPGFRDCCARQARRVSLSVASRIDCTDKAPLEPCTPARHRHS
jgi:hypothetical protein